MDSNTAVGTLFQKHSTKCGQRLPRPRAFWLKGAGQESNLLKPWTLFRQSSVFLTFVEKVIPTRL